MTSYCLKLPIQLQEKAAQCAASQGVSLEEFIIWAIAEKVGILNQCLNYSKLLLDS